MEEVGSLVPVNPHTTKVIAQQVVERVSREEAQAVGNPVGLISRISVVWLGLSSEVTDGLCAFLVCARPHSESNAV